MHAAGFEALAGRGARALVEGNSIAVGGPRLLAEVKATVPPEVEKVTSAWASEGRTVLSVVTEGRSLGALAVEDEIRPESREAVTDLHRLGIRTVGELRFAEPRRLQQACGNQALHWQRLAAGLDERPVDSSAEEKSLSAETTFVTDLTTLDQALSWLTQLAERVGERLRAHGLQGRTVTVKLRKPPFETATRQASLPEPTDSTGVA